MRSYLSVYGIEPKEKDTAIGKVLLWHLPHGKARFHYNDSTWEWTFDIEGAGPMKFRTFGSSPDRVHAIKAIRRFLRAFDKKFIIRNQPVKSKR